MSTPDLLSEAVAELYAADLDAFTERRGELAAAARAAGDRVAAKAIAGLRRPSRSAWVINRLVRADPTVSSRLTELGDELRASEASLDGARVRELSQERRRLIETLVRDALAAAGQDSPSGTVREEVGATFAAALANPEFAAEMAAGSLLRAEQPPGFGSADMTAWIAPAPPAKPASSATKAASSATKAASSATKAASSATKAATAATAAKAKATAPSSAAKAGAIAKPTAAQTAAAKAAAAEAKAAAAAAATADAERERERKRREAIEAAELALAEASQAAEAAAGRERDEEAAVRLLEQQLTDALQRLEDARRQARRANSVLREARQARGRLH